ncbi:MAG: 3-deoxy-D-manno-octulosonic acid kinase, partial [Saprospiraceae bacterium]|nr:3-deoxy-D-manno-octulosonic acid kinase [Saprospiraceae bacterium]
PCVLRQYLRGGMVARFIRSRYLFTGYENSRPFREFRVLAKLSGLRLPAPVPVAALCVRHGAGATGAIITREIENVKTLEQVAGSMNESEWRSVGATLRSFHDHGLVHADLTVRNILVQEGGRVFLVDFDRARFQDNAKGAFKRGLKRLHRSMVKSQLEKEKGLDESAWMQLLNGYG